MLFSLPLAKNYSVSVSQKYFIVFCFFWNR